MTIQTKFNYNDEVFFMKNNKISNGQIVGIQTYTNNSPSTTIHYTIRGNEGRFMEPDLFKSKEELLKSL